MKQTLTFLGLSFNALLLFSGCAKDINDFPASNLRSISSFAFEPYHNAKNNIVIRHEGVIDQANKIIKVQLPPDVILTQLRPKIELSPWTTVSPRSLEYVDFVKDTVDFVVTAESGKQAVYSVVKELNFVYNKAEIYSIVFPEIPDKDGEPTRFSFPNFNNGVTITSVLPQGNDLTRLLVSLDLSPASKGCAIQISENGTDYRPFVSPSVVDFTHQVTFRATSQSGNTVTYYINLTIQTNENAK